MPQEHSFRYDISQLWHNGKAQHCYKITNVFV